MLYRSECLPIKNEVFGEKVGVSLIEDKMREAGLRCLVRVMAY